MCLIGAIQIDCEDRAHAVHISRFFAQSCMHIPNYGSQCVCVFTCNTQIVAILICLHIVTLSVAFLMWDKTCIRAYEHQLGCTTLLQNVQGFLIQ